MPAIMDYQPVVVQAVPGPGKTVYAYFSDGSIRHVNVQPLIKRGGVFDVLADDAVFCERLTVLNNTVAWDIAGNRNETRCIDLDPWKLYQDSPAVADPLNPAA